MHPGFFGELPYGQSWHLCVSLYTIDPVPWYGVKSFFGLPLVFGLAAQPQDRQCGHTSNSVSVIGNALRLRRLALSKQLVIEVHREGCNFPVPRV